MGANARVCARGRSGKKRERRGGREKEEEKELSLTEVLIFL
jgi:hypothetical protein